MYFNHSKLKKEGIFLINNFLDADDCHKIIEEANCKKVDQSEVRVDILPSEYRVWNAEKVFDSVDLLLKDKAIKFISDELNLEPSFCIYNHIKPGKYGSGGSWHRDTRFQNQYKCIIYLTDCSNGYGNFAYIKKSHRNLTPYAFTRLMDLFQKPRYEYLSSLLKPFSSNIYGHKGTAIVVNTTGIHRGTPALKGDRHALTIYFNNGVDLDPKK